MQCKRCGREFADHSYGGLCQACYRYFYNGGEEHPLPQPGTIQKDDRGYVICHICGRSYKRLGSHVKESHEMTITQYKEMFGLCRRSRTTEDNYSKVMHDYAREHRMGDQLRIAGINTRIQKGQNTYRKGKAVRLQEILDKRKRFASKQKGEQQ